jgi:hypothetical protein
MMPATRGVLPATIALFAEMFESAVRQILLGTVLVVSVALVLLALALAQINVMNDIQAVRSGNCSPPMPPAWPPSRSKLSRTRTNAAWTTGP